MRLRVAVLVVVLGLVAGVGLRPAQRTSFTAPAHSSSSGQLAGRPAPAPALPAVVRAVVSPTTAQTFAAADRVRGPHALHIGRLLDRRSLPASSTPVVQRNLPLLI